MANKNKKTTLATLALILLAPSAYSSVLKMRVLRPKAIVVNQASCPVRIFKEALLIPAERLNSKGSEMDLIHIIALRNEGPKLVAAVHVKIIVIDAFGKHIGTHDGYYLEPLVTELPKLIKATSGFSIITFIQTAPKAFLATRSIVFIQELAFSDGSLWKASNALLLPKIHKIAPELKLPSDLTGDSYSMPVDFEYLGQTYAISTYLGRIRAYFRAMEQALRPAKEGP